MAINFYLTTAGRQEVIAQKDLGLSVKLVQMGVGTGQYDAKELAKNMTALKQESERFSLSGGFVDDVSSNLRLIAYIDPTSSLDVHEIGIITENGTLFAVASSTDPLAKLLVNIISIFTFGFSIDDIDTSSIKVGVDANSPIAVALMQKHISNDDPHPQYKTKKDFNETHINVADPHPQYLLKHDFNEHMSNIYPKILAAGVVTGAKNTINVADIVDDLRESKYVIQVTPEGSHEAWDLTRHEKAFDLLVFNRSGTNRIGYSGNINWSIIQNSTFNPTSGNGDYFAGEYLIPILPKEKKKFLLVGAGGGGGLGVHQDDQTYEGISGANGGNTKLVLNEDIAVAMGGVGGELGWWDNGSAWRNGDFGAGGAFTALAVMGDVKGTKGNNGNALAYNRKGGDSLSPVGEYGAGGAGGAGAGSGDEGLGAGGGSGALLECTYINNEEKIIYLRLIVGTGGSRGQYDSKYADRLAVSGLSGFARVSTL